MTVSCLGEKPLRRCSTQRRAAPVSISLSSANLFPNICTHRTMFRYKPISSAADPCYVRLSCMHITS
jgi:hypothetical protein